MSAGLLDRILAAAAAGDPPPFALLHRVDRDPDVVDVLLCTSGPVDTLADVPLPEDGVPGDADRNDVLVLVPHRQVRERGFACVDDDAPLVAMSVAEQATAPLDEVVAALDAIAARPLDLGDARFEPDDDSYAETVARVLDSEIAAGEGANFVVSRSFVADVSGFTVDQACTVLRRLLARESDAYWTFLVHTGHTTLIGSTPERHVTQRAGRATMNPISGTYRYGPDGPRLDDLLEFLADDKEADELYMVLDEELKMMARVCAEGGRVRGPHLREMARLAHTGYLIEGESTLDPRTVLRETLLAPTVTGSPLESACRVITRHEPEGRGYYSGVAALVGRDRDGTRFLDSAILIRTAQIDPSGRLRLGVGSTLVRDSCPDGEVAETRAKAAGVLDALRGRAAAPRPVTRLGAHRAVTSALAGRNDGLSGFWLDEGRELAIAELSGRRALVCDAEDTFTAMLGHQLAALGLDVEVHPVGAHPDPEGFDVTLLGPGPGDPRGVEEPRIAALWETTRDLLVRRLPFLSVCLSHQVLCCQLGFPVRRRAVPNQGVRRRVDLFGRPDEVGFYNSFVAVADADRTVLPGLGPLEVSREECGEVHAVRGPWFASAQFHPESVLTRDGPGILTDLLLGALAHGVAPAEPAASGSRRNA